MCYYVVSVRKGVNMKKCNMCGSQLQDSYNSCPNCGNPNLTVMDQMQGQPMGGAQQPYGQPMPGQPMGGMQQQYGQPMGGMQQPYGQPMPGPVIQPVDNSKGSFGWAVLGFLIPIVGWVLYFCWKNTKPGNAKMAGIGGLVGWAFWFITNLMMKM